MQGEYRLAAKSKRGLCMILKGNFLAVNCPIKKILGQFSITRVYHVLVFTIRFMFVFKEFNVICDCSRG